MTRYFAPNRVLILLSERLSNLLYNSLRAVTLSLIELSALEHRLFPFAHAVHHHGLTTVASSSARPFQAI